MELRTVCIFATVVAPLWQYCAAAVEDLCRTRPCQCCPVYCPRRDLGATPPVLRLFTVLMRR